jgi:serralysin
VNGDGHADLVLGRARGAAVRVFDGDILSETSLRVRIAAFAPPGGAIPGGVRVAVRDVNGDGIADIMTASGEFVAAFAGGADMPASGSPDIIYIFDPEPAIIGGVRIG